MATKVGITKAYIGLVKDDGTLVTDNPVFGSTGIYEINATNGGVISANISGLASNQTPIYGSNVIVGMSGQGANKPAVALNANDVPDEILSVLAGMKKDEEIGDYYIDDKTKPPYAGIILESQLSDEAQSPVWFALPKGTFTPEEQNLQQNTENVNRVTDNVTFTGINRKQDKRIYSILNSTWKNADFEKWFNYIFPKPSTGVKDPSKSSSIVNPPQNGDQNK